MIQSVIEEDERWTVVGTTPIRRSGPRPAFPLLIRSGRSEVPGPPQPAPGPGPPAPAPPTPTPDPHPLPPDPHPRPI
jgi:hypothetical protein